MAWVQYFLRYSQLKSKVGARLFKQVRLFGKIWYLLSSQQIQVDEIYCHCAMKLGVYNLLRLQLNLSKGNNLPYFRVVGSLGYSKQDAFSADST